MVKWANDPGSEVISGDGNVASGCVAMGFLPVGGSGGGHEQLLAIPGCYSITSTASV